MSWRHLLPAALTPRRSMRVAQCPCSMRFGPSMPHHILDDVISSMSEFAMLQMMRSCRRPSRMNWPEYIQNGEIVMIVVSMWCVIFATPCDQLIRRIIAVIHRSCRLQDLVLQKLLDHWLSAV